MYNEKKCVCIYKSVLIYNVTSVRKLNYVLILEASSCKYLGIILCSDLSWADQVNYTVKKAWKALHFTMRILKKGNSNTKSLAYVTLVRPILEYGAACWDPYREGQISTLNRAQKKEAKFAHHTNSPNWETLASRRKLSCLGALFKAYSGEQAWKAIGDRLQQPHYLSRVNHERKLGVGGTGEIQGNIPL